MQTSGTWRIGRATGVLTMQLNIYVALVGLVVLLGVYSPSSEARGFPGKGSMAAWERAHEAYDEGYQLSLLGNPEQAIAKFRTAIVLYPYDADFYYDLGNAYCSTDQWPLAEQAYRSSLKINDKIWSTWLELGTALKWQGKIAESKEALSTALQLNPDAQGRARIEKALATLNEKPAKKTVTSPAKSRH